MYTFPLISAAIYQTMECNPENMCNLRMRNSVKGRDVSLTVRYTKHSITTITC